MITETFPAGPITPVGAYHVVQGDQPQVVYRSYDDAIAFQMMGGKSYEDPNCPERVIIKSLKGLIPPWEKLEQQGANQDGVTFIKAVYGAMMVEAGLELIGRPGKPLRRLVNKWIAANDATQTGELSCVTEFGRWWAPVRWAKNPIDPLLGAQHSHQPFNWSWQADSGFWRTYDNVDVFSFSYTTIEDFGTDYPNNIGPNWPLYYGGPGAGNVHVQDGQMRWNAQTGSRSAEYGVVYGPKAGYTTTTDHQVVTIKLGTIPTWTFQKGTFVDVWMRMGHNPNGTWNGDGVRARFGYDQVILSRFTSFGETVMRTIPMGIPPLHGDELTGIAGTADGDRIFQVQRNGAQLFQFVEPDSNSLMDSSHRGVGGGLQAAGGVAGQTPPPNIMRITAGDNTTQTQSGLLKRVNIGDQDAPDRYTLFGPGTFSIANGPGGDPITFGPLLSNQIVQLRTLARKTAVVDITSTPPTQQQLNLFQEALKDVLSFASGGNDAPLIQSIESVFGIMPPQGNLYTLLKGRFNKPIPAKKPGQDAPTYQVAVSISGGNAQSKIVAALTPQRRYWA